MCVFCAAIPIAGAIGASARAKQQRMAHSEDQQSETPQKKLIIPAGPAMALVIVGLLVGSITVHTHFNF